MAKLAALGKDREVDRYCEIDDEDFGWLATINWWLDYSGYFISKQGRLNRLLMAAPRGMIVHHKDGDIYNNRKENLELLRPEEHRILHDEWSREGKSLRKGPIRE